MGIRNWYGMVWILTNGIQPMEFNGMIEWDLMKDIIINQQAGNWENIKHDAD